jgi:hypothetical protein
VEKLEVRIQFVPDSGPLDSQDTLIGSYHIVLVVAAGTDLVVVVADTDLVVVVADTDLVVVVADTDLVVVVADTDLVVVEDTDSH